MILGWPSCKLAKIEPQEMVQNKMAETEKGYKTYGHNKNENTS